MYCSTVHVNICLCYVYVLTLIYLFFFSYNINNHSALLEVMLETLDSNGKTTGLSDMAMKVSEVHWLFFVFVTFF